MADYTFLPQKHDKSFKNIVDRFPKKLMAFSPVKNAFSLNKYFSKGIGKQGALKLLYKDGLLDSPNDFKGIYIFIKDKQPIYTGISKGVIKRIIQHTKGSSHHTSSFAYALAKVSHEKSIGKPIKITRKEFNFKKHVTPAKAFLSEQKIAFMEIEDDLELYLFELYCAMELQTLMYNNFSTH